MDHLMAIFCDLDDFCKAFAPVYDRCLLHAGQRHRARQTTLALSEILTLLVSVPWSRDRTFVGQGAPVKTHSCMRSAATWHRGRATVGSVMPAVAKLRRMRRRP